MTADLAAFLLARYDDEEAAARAAILPIHGQTGEWVTFDGNEHLTSSVVFARQGVGGDRLGQACDTAMSWIGTPARDHIARWDPARVLAECEARRRIVAESARWGVPRKIRPEYRGDLFFPEGDDKSLIRQHHPVDDVSDDEPQWELGRLWRRADYEADVLEPQEEFIFLRLLALPYSSHPDYDPAWRP